MTSCFPGVPQPGFVAMRTNVSSAHLLGDRKRRRDRLAADLCRTRSAARIVPIDIDPNLRFTFDIWLTYHPDAARIPRVRRMIDWIVDSFDPRKHFPWFRDEFIHPNDLPTEYRGAPLVNLFEGFLGAAHDRRSD